MLNAPIKAHRGELWCRVGTCSVCGKPGRYLIPHSHVCITCDLLSPAEQQRKSAERN